MSSERPLVGVQIHGTEVADATQVVRDLGVEITVTHLNWGTVESDAGAFDWSALEWWQQLREELGSLPQQVFTLYPVHMNERGPLPADLRTVPFDSAQMLERFEGFVAQAAERAGWKDSSPIVVIGNEVNIFADSHPDELDAVLGFLAAGADAIRRHAPGARVVNTCTYDTISKRPDLVRALNASTDLAAFTWYELGPAPDFKLPGLSDMAEVVDRMEEAAGDKPVLIKEIGLPAAEILDSSEQIQARRVTEMFEVLSGRSRDRVVGAIWLCVDDWPVEPLREYVRHQFPFFDGNEEFLAFLTSNGIRTHDRRPKAGWQAWREQLAGYVSS